MGERSDRYDLAGKVIGLAMRVHSALGPGFLESVYENALALELEEAGIAFQSQPRIPVQYKGRVVGDFVCDLLIENTLVVELKATLNLVPAHEVQTVNYLTATGIAEGLLLNFGSQKLQFKKKFRQDHPVNCFARSRSSHPSGCFPKQAASRVPTRRCSVKKASAFTMLELLVSMAVLSMLVVLLLSMVDNASTMWRQSENRVDAYREARAALNMIARDLNSIYLSGRDLDADIFYVDDISRFAPAPATASSEDHLSGKLFFVTALPPSAQGTGEKSDLCTVGYFAGFDRTSLGLSAEGGNESMNLYRYFRGSNDTFEAIKTPAPDGGLGEGVSLQTLVTDDFSEVLARNITGFEIKAYTVKKDDPTKLIEFDPTATTPVPDILEITLSAISNDAAKRFTTKSEWEKNDSPTHEQHVRTFTKRVVLNRPAPAPAP